MDNYEHTPGGKPFNDLDAYFSNDHLSDDEKKLLAELDAIDSHTSNLAVEFTDDDIIHNVALLGQMDLIGGHANNVECKSYTYVINVYNKDAVNGTYNCTRIYEFTDNVIIQLVNLFSTLNAHFIHRSTTESFAAADVPYVNHIDKRQVNVYDLIVPEGFDIDSTFYFYNKQITCFDPWTIAPATWETSLRDEWVDTFDDLQGYGKFTAFELFYLKMAETTPHILNTRQPLCMLDIKEKE